MDISDANAVSAQHDALVFALPDEADDQVRVLPRAPRNGLAPSLENRRLRYYLYLVAGDTALILVCCPRRGEGAKISILRRILGLGHREFQRMAAGPYHDRQCL